MPLHHKETTGLIFVQTLGKKLAGIPSNIGLRFNMAGCHGNCSLDSSYYKSMVCGFFP